MLDLTTHLKHEKQTESNEETLSQNIKQMGCHKPPGELVSAAKLSTSAWLLLR